MRYLLLILILLPFTYGSAVLYQEGSNATASTAVYVAQQSSPPGSPSPESTISQAQARSIPSEITSRRTEWYLYFLTWATLHYAFGVGSVICSVSVAALGAEEGSKNKRRTLSIIAAICAGLLTFLTPAVNARAYIQAWRTLDSACRQYQFNSQMTLQNLNEALDNGELIIEGAVLSGGSKRVTPNP